MKTKITYSLLAAAAACGFAQAQTTAYTTPVGYITQAIAANGSGAETYLSPSLIQPSVFAGASTATPSGLSTIDFSGSVPAALDGTYLLEITSGASAGWWSTVASSTATSITVTDAFPSGLTIGTTVAVRKHSTVGNFLGANSPGLTPFDGVNPNDEVIILNPVTQATTTLAYVPTAVSGLPDGWFDLVLSASADNYVIEPGTAIKIKLIGSTSLSVVSSGEVKLTPTQVDVFPNFNWIGTPLAVGGTLDYMNFAAQLIPFDGVSTTSDELSFLDAAQVSTPYASLDPSFGLGVVMGNLVTSSPAGDYVFPGGTGAVLKRAASTPANVLTVPGTVVAP